MTVAMLVLMILNLVVLLALFGRLGDVLVAIKELGVRVRDAKAEQRW